MRNESKAITDRIGFCLILALLLQTGCTQQRIPTIPAIESMEVEVQPNEYGQKWELLKVPQNRLGVFLNLIYPHQARNGRIIPDIHPLRAIVRFRHKSGSKSEIMVRHDGANPLLVSLDGEPYFYGGDTHGVGGDVIFLFFNEFREASEGVKGKYPLPKPPADFDLP